MMRGAKGLNVQVTVISLGSTNLEIERGQQEHETAEGNKSAGITVLSRPPERTHRILRAEC